MIGVRMAGVRARKGAYGAHTCIPMIVGWVSSRNNPIHMSLFKQGVPFVLVSVRQQILLLPKIFDKWVIFDSDSNHSIAIWVDDKMMWTKLVREVPPGPQHLRGSLMIMILYTHGRLSVFISKCHHDTHNTTPWTRHNNLPTSETISLQLFNYPPSLIIPPLLEGPGAEGAEKILGYWDLILVDFLNKIDDFVSATRWRLGVFIPNVSTILTAQRSDMNT